MARIKSPIGKRRGAPAEGGDAFRAQHQARRVDEREVEGVRRPVLVNEAESPLGWLKRRKDRNGRPVISDEQYQAGERLRADYWFAHLSPRVTANWSAPASPERTRRALLRGVAARRGARGEGTGDAGADDGGTGSL